MSSGKWRPFCLGPNVLKSLEGLDWLLLFIFERPPIDWHEFVVYLFFIFSILTSNLWYHQTYEGTVYGLYETMKP